LGVDSGEHVADFGGRGVGSRVRLRLAAALELFAEAAGHQFQVDRLAAAGCRNRHKPYSAIAR
jgi:hypothetical protein